MMEELFTWLVKALFTEHGAVAGVLAVGWVYAEYGRARERADDRENRKAYQAEAAARIKVAESTANAVTDLALAVARIEGSLGVRRDRK